MGGRVTAMNFAKGYGRFAAAVNSLLVVLLCLGAASAQSAPLKIAILGDSLAAGFGVKPSESFPARLEAALRGTRNLILSCDLIPTGWEDPLPRFATAAAAIGHAHSEVDRLDGVSRALSLEETAGNQGAHQRRWALALEAFRISRNQPITESPDDLQVGSTTIPAPRSAAGRPMLIRYLPNGIPTIPVIHILETELAIVRQAAKFLDQDKPHPKGFTR